jgi:hypothetical protein
MKNERTCKRYFSDSSAPGGSRVGLYDTRPVGVIQLLNSSRVSQKLRKTVDSSSAGVDSKRLRNLPPGVHTF